MKQIQARFGRRGFIRQSTGILAVVGSGVSLVSCVNDTGTPVNDPNASGPGTGGGGGGGGGSGQPVTGGTPAGNTPVLAQQGVTAEQMLQWFIDNERIYTQADPGQHGLVDGRPAGHDPKYLASNLYVGGAPDATHAMTEEHSIELIGLRDQGTGKIVYATFLDWRVDALALRVIPPDTLNIPAGSTLVPCEWCDDHNFWIGTPTVI